MSTDRFKPVEPMPAATLVLVRERAGELQVLLSQKNPKSRFMGGFFVFPGGRIEAADHDQIRWQHHVDLSPRKIRRRIGRPDAVAAAMAAIRETFEETGILLAAADRHNASALQALHARRMSGDLSPEWLQRLVETDNWVIQLSALLRWSRWITPDQMRYRFDTWFFLARMPSDQVCQPDMRETVHAVWLSPKGALQKNLAGEIRLSPPTLITLHEMLTYALLQDLVGAAAQRQWARPLKPRLVADGTEKLIIEPWDPEYRQSQVRIDSKSLRAAVAPVGKSFSRLWYSRGIWKPVAF